MQDRDAGRRDGHIFGKRAGIGAADWFQAQAAILAAAAAPVALAARDAGGHRHALARGKATDIAANFHHGADKFVSDNLANGNTGIPF